LEKIIPPHLSIEYAKMFKIVGSGSYTFSLPQNKRSYALNIDVKLGFRDPDALKHIFQRFSWPNANFHLPVACTIIAGKYFDSL